MSGETGPSLTSDSTYRGLYLISEGPIYGFATTDPAQSIYLNNVPVKDDGGQINFDGLSYNFRYGMPSQSHISSFDSANDPVPVQQKVYNASPYQVELPTNYDAIIVTVGSPALYRIDSSGSVADQGVEFAIDWQAAGSSTWNTAYDQFLKAKQTAPWELSYRITLPAANGPYLVRVRRITSDNDNDQVFDDIYFNRYEAVTNGKFTYPNCALIAIECDAKEFGTTIPSVAVKCQGIVVNVPANYDPVARTYATSGTGTTNGVWDGTFKKTWTNNPAWIFYDLLISNRYGLGQWVNPTNNPESAFADKWQLYTISQYCDGWVDDGYGGQEPRFTFNGYINNKDDAYTFLQNVATAFRGMLYFSSDQIFASADIPPPGISDIFTNADVQDGAFAYQSSPLKTRSSVVVSQFLNPDNYYAQDYEVVQDNEAIFQFGYRQKNLNGFGVTSRGLARRLAKWLLLTEKYQTQVVSFKTGLRGGYLLPGAVIKIYDQYKAGTPLGGRILNITTSGSNTIITIDRTIDIVDGQNQSINIVMPDLTLGTYPIIGNYGNTNTIIISGSLSQTPVPGAVYAISSPELDGVEYRVSNVAETNRGVYEITAVLQYPEKYSLIEQGPAFSTAPSSIISNVAIPPPTSINVVEGYNTVNGAAVAPKITVSWQAPDDPRVSSYNLQLSTVDNSVWTTVYTGSFTSWDSGTLPLSTGNAYQCQVQSVCDSLGTTSTWLQSATFDIVGKTDLPNPPSAILATPSFNSITVTWTNITDSDFAYVEVWGANVNDVTQSSLLAQVGGTSFIETNLGAQNTRYYFLRSVTYAATDNISLYAGEVSATTTAITSSDLGSGSVTTAAIATGAIVSSSLAAAAVTAQAIAAGTIAAAAYAEGLAAIPTYTTATLPNPSTYTGTQPVLNETDGNLYNIVDGAWVANVGVTNFDQLTVPNGSITSAMIANGAIAASQLASGAVTASSLAAGAVGLSALSSSLAAPQVVSTLPSVSGWTGSSIVFNQADGQIYRLVSGAWVATVPAVNLTGSIAGTQIAAGAITTNNLAAGAVTTATLAAGAVTTGTIAAGAITSTLIQAGAIGATQIAANAVTTAALSAGSITASKLSLLGDSAAIDPYFQDFNYWGQITTFNTTNNTNIATYTLSTNSSNGWYQANSNSIGVPGCVAMNSSLTAPTAGWANTRYILYCNWDGTFTSGEYKSVLIPVSAGSWYEIAFTGINTSNQQVSYGVDTYSNSGTYTGTYSVSAPAGSPLGYYTSQVQMPSGAAYARQWVEQNSGNAQTTFSGIIEVGGLIFRQANTASMYVNGTINANALVANSITSGQIAAGAITSTQIAAGTIVASNIASGAITANTLAVGTGTNLLWGSDQVLPPGDVVTWIPGGNDSGSAMIIGTAASVIGTAYTISDGTTWCFHQPNTYQGTYPYDEFLFEAPTLANNTYGANNGMNPVSPSTFYELSGYLCSYRCNSYMQIDWYESDATTYISSTQTNGANNNNASGFASCNVLPAYVRCWVSTQSPANAYYARIQYVKGRTISGQSDSYLFAVRPQFLQNLNSVTTPTSWSPPGVTLISGGSIIANSVTADKISVTSLSAVSANIGTVTAGIIESTSGNVTKNLNNGLDTWTTGSNVLVRGANFGVSSNLMEWFGSLSNLFAGNCTIDDSIYCMDNTGTIYTQGKQIEGGTQAGGTQAQGSLGAPSGSYGSGLTGSFTKPLVSGGFIQLSVNIYPPGSSNPYNSGTAAQSGGWQVVATAPGGGSSQVIASGTWSGGAFVSGEGVVVFSMTGATQTVLCPYSGVGVSLSLELYSNGNGATWDAGFVAIYVGAG
jgi:predicted phage tail protein